MTDGTIAGSMGREGAPAVEDAARLVIDAGWARDDSAFTPGAAIWTAEHADELYEHYVQQPDVSGDDFMEKFAKQLSPVSNGAKQLAAEIFYLNLLPLSDYFGKKKRQLITDVLSWCGSDIVIPPELDAALDKGVFNGGVAFKTQRWQQLSLLIQLVRQWKQLPVGDRQAALADPWSFRDFIQGAVGPRQPAQRTSLLYLAFPGTFLSIVKGEHKKKIRQAFLEYAQSPTGDLDKDLLAIRTAMEQEQNASVDFYKAPWRERWLEPAEAASNVIDDVPAEADSRRAWLIRGSSVQGRDLVPIWLARGSCSLQASRLRPVEIGLGEEQLKTYVDADYSDISYSARSEKVGEFHAFLNRMRVGDLVVTTSQGKLYLGVITGEASYVASSDGRSNLRRPVQWRNSDHPADYADLPDPLPARLAIQHDVVELTREIALLDELLGEEPQALPPREAHLPDATTQLAEGLLVEQDWLQECIELLRDRRQIIFYGPPGTGKTYIGQRLAWFLAGRENTKLVQFHPAYSYEDFFEGFRPVQSAAAGSVGFKLAPGPFRQLVDRAKAEPATPYVLIIDEINRANLAKVFGELYFLLEYREEAIDLLYSSGDEQAFTLPKNVFLIGTMNTADRSIALVDTAMRRRFAFVPLHPSEAPTNGLLDRWLAREEYPDTAARLLAALNARIEDQDFKIGPSYLMRPAAQGDGGLERVWRSSIMPLLEEHHYGESIDLDKRYGLTALRKAIEPMAAPEDTESN